MSKIHPLQLSLVIQLPNHIFGAYFMMHVQFELDSLDILGLTHMCSCPMEFKLQYSKTYLCSVSWSLAKLTSLTLTYAIFDVVGLSWVFQWLRPHDAFQTRGAHFTKLCMNTCIKNLLLLSWITKMGQNFIIVFMSRYTWYLLHSKNGNQIWGSIILIKHTISN